jgi:aerobic-type carbon monoxide dehydrogenase small subunit (CoxS/CutS family)
MPEFRFAVNGQRVNVNTVADRPLLDVLREDLHLTGTKYGCGEGQCRACTVLIDGKPAVSCLTPVRAAAGREITTIEGLTSGTQLHPVQQAFVDEGAMQCGYCTPGMVLRTTALLQANASPSRDQIVEAMNGSLCRCCSYPRILAAVQRAIDSRKETPIEAGE